jgi:hypothetical protein
VSLDRFFVLTYESLVANPAMQMAALYEWLGIDSAFRSDDLDTPRNVSPKIIRYRMPALENALVRRVAPLIPPPARRLINQLTTREVDVDRYPAADVHALIRPRQLEQVEELSAILGRRFPEWSELTCGRSSRASG